MPKSLNRATQQYIISTLCQKSKTPRRICSRVQYSNGVKFLSRPSICYKPNPTSSVQPSTRPPPFPIVSHDDGRETPPSHLAITATPPANVVTEAILPAPFFVWQAGVASPTSAPDQLLRTRHPPPPEPPQRRRHTRHRCRFVGSSSPIPRHRICFPDSLVHHTREMGPLTRSKHGLDAGAGNKSGERKRKRRKLGSDEPKGFSTLHMPAFVTRLISGSCSSHDCTAFLHCGFYLVRHHFFSSSRMSVIIPLELPTACYY